MGGLPPYRRTPGGGIVTADDVVISWKTPGVVSATVRDDRGVWDVRWSASTGWSCTCAEPGCAHAAAVRQLTQAVN